MRHASFVLFSIACVVLGVGVSLFLARDVKAKNMPGGSL